MQRHLWTQEDEEYLRTKWGSISIKAIAKKINCTPEAVKHRAIKLKLGGYLNSSDLITISSLTKEIFGKDMHDQSTRIRKRWEKLGLVFHKRIIDKRYLYMINIDEFWEWLEKHKSAVNLSKLEPGVLGKEPEWVKTKRKNDILKVSKEYKFWTKAEEDRLKLMIHDGLSITEIAKNLRRTVPSVNIRIVELKLGMRPKREKKASWTPDEDRILKQALINGEGFDKAARDLNRSQESCLGRCYRLWKTTNQLRLQEMLTN